MPQRRLRPAFVAGSGLLLPCHNVLRSHQTPCCSAEGDAPPRTAQQVNQPKVSKAGRASSSEKEPPRKYAGFGSAVTIDEMTQSLHGTEDPIWELMQREAATAAADEPQLASSLYASILVHYSMEETLATVLSNALDTSTFQATQWMELFRDALADDPEYGKAVRADIKAFMERDPASSHAARVLLYSKGFHALESWRLARWLWDNGRHSLALYLQSMISNRFAVDIHPAATIGKGILIDHGTGIVIGETAILGDNVSLLHNVTLGGTGKETGDRHPKVGDGVMIGAGAAILGNISVGTGAHIAACSVVLKPVEPFAIISGVPGKMVGKVSYKAGVMPSFIMDQMLSIEVLGAANPYQNVVTGSVKAVDDPAEEGVFGGSSI